ncbi:NUDIX hydrolase [Nocardia abscessus]|uniref:NUDIX hydrolase n=1 Tax=Nocardia abscessus TaxID=120957 RepID=UPI0005BB5315|nr:NUDIX domain-containing protein [Nocardia abscessus]MCC3332055.1 NUDIX hydrolase [Nocardia abscessus]
MTGRLSSLSAVTVDLVILTIRHETLEVLVIERATAPYVGALALPGGFLEPGENLDQAAHRELAEETGLDADTLHIEQIGAYGDPDRDPRGRVVSVCYMAMMPDLPHPAAGGDARAVRWVPVETLAAQPDRLAFDHHKLLLDAVERARGKLSYTTLAASFCPPRFTVADLRRVYEIVWGIRLDPSNFRRKVTGVPGFLVRDDDRTAATGGRPAHLYRTGPAIHLHPALSRETLIEQH